MNKLKYFYSKTFIFSIKKLIEFKIEQSYE